MYSRSMWRPSDISWIYKNKRTNVCECFKLLFVCTNAKSVASTWNARKKERNKELNSKSALWIQTCLFFVCTLCTERLASNAYTNARLLVLARVFSLQLLRCHELLAVRIYRHITKRTQSTHPHACSVSRDGWLVMRCLWKRKASFIAHAFIRSSYVQSEELHVIYDYSFYGTKLNGSKGTFGR